MKKHLFVALFLAVMCVAVWPRPVNAQSDSSTTDPSAVPRLADGRPDLQGVWDFRSTVPLQRREQRDESKIRAARQADDPRNENVPAYNAFWLDSGASVEDERTSLIVDPPDGKLPPLAPGAARQVGSYQAAHLPAERPIRYRGGGTYPNSYEDRGLAERCILGFNSGPPVIPGGYNQNLQVFQTSDHVVIYNEMVHNARIVPLDGRPRLPDSIRQWVGDSRGYWDGDTLVIESTNFTDKTSGFDDGMTSGMGDGTALYLTERLRRVDANTLEYEFTLDDRQTFSRPFTAMLPMAKSDSLIYEFACHEGNYGLRDILAGARVEELRMVEDEAK